MANMTLCMRLVRKYHGRRSLGDRILSGEREQLTPYEELTLDQNLSTQYCRQVVPHFSTALRAESSGLEIGRSMNLD